MYVQIDSHNITYDPIPKNQSAKLFSLLNTLYLFVPNSHQIMNNLKEMNNVCNMSRVIDAEIVVISQNDKLPQHILNLVQNNTRIIPSTPPPQDNTEVALQLIKNNGIEHHLAQFYLPTMAINTPINTNPNLTHIKNTTLNILQFFSDTNDIINIEPCLHYEKLKSMIIDMDDNINTDSYLELTKQYKNYFIKE